MRRCFLNTLMITEIISVHNPRVKEWSQLLDKKGRARQGKFLIEGTHLVIEALHADAKVETILFSMERGIPAEIDPNVYSHVECVAVSEAVLAKCTDTQTPQSILAIVRKSEVTVESLLADLDNLIVVIDGVQDPGNLGTIIRSADAVGAAGVLLGKGTVDIYNPKTVRSTMGSLFHLPIVECDLLAVLSEAKKRNIRLLNTSLQAKQNCYEAEMTGPLWIIVGNEGSGVSPEVGALVDQHVIIPMQGQAESLNVAMATTVLLYEAFRQRHYPTQINS